MSPDSRRAPAPGTTARQRWSRWMDFALLILGMAAGAAGLAQSKPGEIERGKAPEPAAHDWVEYAWDQPTSLELWDQVGPGLAAGFGTTDDLYVRCEPPAGLERGRGWEGTGWRGERLNAQLLVWSATNASQVRITPSDLTNSAGGTLPQQTIGVRLVRYVLSNFEYGAHDFSCDVSNTQTYLMPDRLELADRFDLPARTVRPVWISIDIPSGTEPGEYRGSIQVDSTRQRVALPVRIRVQGLELPPPSQWRFRLDLWQNPWAVAEYFRVAPWSAEHLTLLRNHLKTYADAGGKYVTTYAVHSPWSDNSYRLEGAMIEWIRAAAGGWKFDYRVFDQYVELAMECGVDRAITVYTPLPWGNRFRYLDAPSGNYIEVVWPPQSDAFRTAWTAFLESLRDHLAGKGWLEKTYLGINENPRDQTLAAIRAIRDHSPSWKITYAGDWHPELSGQVTDYSAVIPREPDREEIRARAAQGLTTSFYVCCGPPRPNTFVFSPPAEARYLGWHAAAFGYDGFLRWAYDAWPADPVRDARHRLWPAGDCYLVYPGGAPSLRLEKLREGIVDYEKIGILRERVRGSSAPELRSTWAQLEALLRGFPGDPEYRTRDYSGETITLIIRRGTDLINALSDQLSGSAPR